MPYSKEYYEKNKAKCKARTMAHRAKNREKYNALSKAWYARNPGKASVARKKSYYKSHYGLTIEEKEAMLIGQSNSCAICSRKLLLGESVVDHCHNTGKIRQILCGTCNSGLGFFKDDKSIVESALTYLDKHLQ